MAPAVDAATAAGDFGSIADADVDVRVSASAAGAPASQPASGTERREHDSARLVGTLVHRLFEHVGDAGTGDPAWLAARLSALVNPRERAGIADLDVVFREAASRFEAIACRPVVARLLSSGERLHEVPFALRRHGELVHGTIDTLVRRDGVVTVVEIKTGRRAPEHERQLALYLEAAAALFPLPTRVEGVLVYPDDELWLSSR